MLSARDVVGHPGGEAAAIEAVRQSGLRVTGLQVLRDFEGLSGHLHLYKVDVAKAMLTLCHALGASVLLVCSTTLAHAADDAEAFVRDLRKLAMLAVPLRSASRTKRCRGGVFFPGEGVHSSDISTLVRRIDDIGYRGDYSFEVFNDDYVQLPLATVAERARRSVKWLVGQVPRRSLPIRTSGGRALSS